MENTEIEVLLIEDNENDAELTIRSLRKGNTVTKIIHLSDGVRALEFLFGTGEFEGRNIMMKPKLILLDIKMPKVDGIEVLQRIKSNPQTRMIPVVMLTSSKENPDINTCYSLGVNSYIVKPVDIGNFRKALEEIGLYWLIHNLVPEHH